jgi:hypothetical protein
MLAAEPKALPKLQKPTSLLSPQLDFWLLGGASILTWLFLAISGRFERVAGMGDLTMNLPMTISFVQILVNYPHFMASYHLCYRRGFAFLRRHWIQTLAVPAILIAYMAYLGSMAMDPTRNPQFRHGLSALVMVMYFTVGWHYTKQAFGCVMAYANYSGYRMDGVQRESIRYAILSVWWYKFCYDSQVGIFTFSDLSGEKWPVLPDYTRIVTFLIFLILQVWVVYRVLIHNASQGRFPHINMVVPYLAILVWTLPQLQFNPLCLAIIPFFHSLQYLAFVYRIEMSEDIRGHHGPLFPSLLALGLIFVGWLTFMALPGNLDDLLANKRYCGVSYFVICFSLFINIHHYFLDNTLWKIRDDALVSRALFGERPVR